MGGAVTAGSGPLAGVILLARIGGVAAGCVAAGGGAPTLASVGSGVLPAACGGAEETGSGGGVTWGSGGGPPPRGRPFIAGAASSCAGASAGARCVGLALDGGGVVAPDGGALGSMGGRSVRAVIWRRGSVTCTRSISTVGRGGGSWSSAVA